MKTFARFITLATAAALCLSLVGCGAAPSGEPIVGIIKLNTHVALDAAEQGFIDALAEAGYEDGKTVTLKRQNALGEIGTLSTIADQFVGGQMDLILAIATPAVQAMAGKTADIPIVGTAVTDYVEAELAATDEAPGGNVTGTSDRSPMAEQFALLQKLCPDAKKVGFLYNSSEVNSVTQIAQAKEICDGLGLSYVEKSVVNSNDVQQVTQAMVGECDVIYLPTDNVFATTMPTVRNICAESKTPVFCGESGPVENGGFATEGLDYYSLGFQTGKMAVKILKGEAKAESMPIEFAEETKICINGDVAKEIGIEIPADLQEFVIFPDKEA